MVWAGWIVSLLPVLIVLISSRWKLTQDPTYVREWGRIGWQVKDLPLIASLQLGAIVLYLILDLDRGREGLLRVSQQSLIDLKSSMDSE